jgi:hypothetical protein
MKAIRIVVALLIVVALTACNMPGIETGEVQVASEDIVETASLRTASSQYGLDDNGCYWDGWMETEDGDWVTCTYVEPQGPEIAISIVPAYSVMEGTEIALTLMLGSDITWAYGTIKVSDSYQGEYWHNLADKDPDTEISWFYDGTDFFFEGGERKTDFFEYSVPIVHPNDWDTVFAVRSGYILDGATMEPGREMRVWIDLNEQFSNRRRWAVTEEQDHTVTVSEGDR